MAAGGLARLDDLLGLDHLEVEQPQRARMVQAVNEVLDVGRRVLLTHQPGDGELGLAAVDHHGGAVHGELGVVAGVIDVQGLTSHRQRKEAHGSSSKTSITE